MKRQLFPVLVLALILPALTGCPSGDPEKSSSTPSGTSGGNLGDGNLVLKGTVYTIDGSTGQVIYEKYTTAGTIEVWARGSGGGSSEKLGEGALTSGEFNISVDKKPTANLDAFDPDYFFGDWYDPTANPTDAKGAGISLGLGSLTTGIGKLEYTYTGSSNMSSKYVEYLYVDRDVTVTLGANEVSDEYTDDDGTTISYTNTYKAATLKLSKGWNALYYEYGGTQSGTTLTQTLSVSVGNPDLRWVLLQ
jgi:hypothetical protein